jgi:hypothetical protein
VFQERLETVLARLADGQPLAPGGRRFLGPIDRATVVPLAEAMTQSPAPLFRALFAAVVALVLLACLNVSGLMAARSLDRARDLALRRAIGARSADIVRLQVMEHAVLLAIGAALGLALSTPLLGITVSLLPHDLNLLKTPALDRARPGLHQPGARGQRRARLGLAGATRAARERVVAGERHGRRDTARAVVRTDRGRRVHRPPGPCC